MLRASDPIGVLVGVPATFAEFSDRFDESDFLAKYELPSSPAERSAALRRHWDESYNPAIGTPLQSFLDALARLNVLVCSGATLEDVSRLSSECSTLIVLSHWKGSSIRFEDLHPACTLESISEQAQRSNSPLARWLIGRISPNLWTGLKFRARPVPVSLLNEAVNLGWAGEEARNAAIDGRYALPVTLAARRRDELDEMLDGLLRPGNRIELFDGMHSKDTFERAVAAHFTGFLDLTTCTSTMLGEHVARVRRGKIRQLNFVKDQDLLWHVSCLPIALEIALQGALEYPDARIEADRLLRTALGDEWEARGGANLET